MGEHCAVSSELLEFDLSSLFGLCPFEMQYLEFRGEGGLYIFLIHTQVILSFRLNSFVF